MTDKILYFKYIDSCETCPEGQREQYGKIRCKEDTEVVFTQNKDMGVPENCPFRKRSVLKCQI
jgi:hypothetical protein